MPATSFRCGRMCHLVQTSPKLARDDDVEAAYMKTWILGPSVAAVFGMAIVSAATVESRAKGKNEQPVTIRGCVRAGTEADTFLLMRVTEVRPGGVRGESVPTDTQGRDVLYWLSSTKGLKVQDGQRVEVKGTVDLSDPQQGETKVSEDSSKRLDSTSEMKSDGKTVTVKTDTQPGVGPTTTAGTLVKSSGPTVQRVVYRLKVRSLRRVEGICQ
jgi:hypothetical protein